MQYHNVIIAPPDTDPRQALAAILNQTFDLTAQPADPRDLPSVCGASRCDIALTDLILSAVADLEVPQHLQAAPVKPFVVVLSGFAADGITGLTLSVDYLMEPADLRRQEPDPGALAAHVLHHLGIPARSRGSQYLKEALLSVVKDPGMVSGITKLLYPQIAKRYHTSPSGVERSIRHAIEVAWDCTDPQILGRYFGHHRAAGKRPTNSDFIALLADHIRSRREISQF